MPFKSTGILTVYVALLIACTSNNISSLPDADFFVQENDFFRLRVGDTVGIVARDAIELVRFNLVVGDSRCPVDVECVTAGFATVVVTVQTALDVQEIEVRIPPEGAVELEVQELTLTFTELRPAAMEGVEIDQLQYELTGRGEQTGEILS